MKSEYKNNCDSCGSYGTNTHARIYYRKIQGEYKYLCSKCWNYFEDGRTVKREQKCLGCNRPSDTLSAGYCSSCDAKEAGIFD